ncbi:MAG: sigma-54-dependent Fis family transcriptional regulator [Myxococcales bacterium]|nr:sigma-54-dependent Fis family transcriptional regulator [Myxococcales bacterium]
MARILVVDDEEGLREFLVEALELSGHDVTPAETAEQALARAGNSHFHVVISDLRLPGKSGLDLLRQLRQDAPDTQVVMLTAHASVESAVDAMRLGAFDYLEKPIGSPAELRLVVDRALEKRGLLAAKEQALRAQDSVEALSYGAESMQPVVAAAERVARTDATVLLLGESGTGKEVLARSIHQQSARRDAPFVAINCAALSSHLLESELFGHEKGAFTGAHARRQGRIELAEGGTFFLDEIGELEPTLQAKLLRVLQDRRFERVGGSRTLAADVRWIAATNRDLRTAMAEGAFREDLYHRLAVFPIRLPPLRERREDIVPLAESLTKRLAGELGRPAPALSEPIKRYLQEAAWPGNIRELRNVLERALILCDGNEVEKSHLWLEPVTSGKSEPPDLARPLVDIEREAIAQALARCGGNRKAASEMLGIGLRTLYDKLKRYER